MTSFYIGVNNLSRLNFCLTYKKRDHIHLFIYIMRVYYVGESEKERNSREREIELKQVFQDNKNIVIKSENDKN